MSEGSIGGVESTMTGNQGCICNLSFPFNSKITIKDGNSVPKPSRGRKCSSRTILLHNATAQASIYGCAEQRLSVYAQNDTCPKPANGPGVIATVKTYYCQKTFDMFMKAFEDTKIYYYEGGQSYSLGSFENRIKAATYPNNATITISNMQPPDSGVYICEVNNPPDFQGNNQGLFFVSVLVEPSKPLCAIHGTPESGHRVSLSCYSQQGNPAPTYTWSKINDGVATKPLGQMDIITGSMTIGNLSQFETGTYQCNASNSQGFSICTVELSEGQSISYNAIISHNITGAHEGAIVGAVIGAVVIAVIIGTVVWFISSKKKGKYNKNKSAGTELQTKAQSDSAVRYQDIPTVETAPVQAHAVEVQKEEPRVLGEEQEDLQNSAASHHSTSPFGCRSSGISLSSLQPSDSTVKTAGSFLNSVGDLVRSRGSILWGASDLTSLTSGKASASLDLQGGSHHVRQSGPPATLCSFAAPALILPHSRLCSIILMLESHTNLYALLLSQVPGSVKSHQIGGLTSASLQKSQTPGTSPSLSPFVSRSFGTAFLRGTVPRVITLICVLGCRVLRPWARVSIAALSQ
ncbi:VSIG1 protein, partial [Polyodon spathula]|nr:VSIG1 protein [Polyodon spathula]